MRCTSPRSVGFKSDGKTLAWSPKNYCKEYATFQLPCGKCIECRLDYARQWAVRCVHEAQMHPDNCFITLTYNDEHLNSKKLVYEDFQKFMKRLRKLTNNEVGMFVTGEYGTINKRPHWHAIIFNWSPKDGTPWNLNPRGDTLYRSKTLEKLWPHGFSSYGEVTFESAGYVARYSAKSLAHEEDERAGYKAISKKSQKNAIGKRWLESHYSDIFNYGTLIINGRPLGSIPRYYEKWLQKNKPDEWHRYVTKIKVDKALAALKQNDIDKEHYQYHDERNHARRKISQSKFKNMLQRYLKF